MAVPNMLNGCHGDEEKDKKRIVVKLFRRKERKLLSDAFERVALLDEADHCKLVSKSRDDGEIIEINREFIDNKLVCSANNDQTKYQILSSNQPNSKTFFAREFEYKVQDFINYDGLHANSFAYAIKKLGRNMIVIPNLPLAKQIFQHLVKQNFFFFVLYEILLVLNGKFIAPFVSMAIQVPFHCSDVFTERWKSSQMRKSIEKSSIQVHVFRDGKWIQCSSLDVYPGDLISVKKFKNNSMIPCDILLKRGRCLVDESSLNGESFPVIKDSISQFPDNFTFNNADECKSSMLYSGTLLLSSESTNDMDSNLSENDHCNGIVLRTGNQTLRGQIVTSTLESFSKNSSKQLGKQLMPIVISMGIIGFVGGIIHFRNSYLQNTNLTAEDLASGKEKKTLYKTVVQSLLIMASAIPGDIQVNIFMAINKGLNHLLGKHIFVSEPTSLLNVYNCNVFCFDKTGTLTKDDVYIHGILDSSNGKLCKKPSDLPVEIRSICLACNSLNRQYKTQNTLFGDKLELALFDFVKGNVKAFDGTGRIHSANELKRSGASTNSLTVKKTFAFSSSLRRMSVLVSHDSAENKNKLILLCKGAPEEIFSRLNKFDQGNNEVFRKWSVQGFRVLAFAYKEVELGNGTELDDLSRDDLESNLNLVGFVIAANSIKENSKDVIEFIQKGNGSVKMVTGDNLLTAASVCGQLGIVDLQKTLVVKEISCGNTLICSKIVSDEIVEIDLHSLNEMTKSNNFAIEGKAIEQLNFDQQIISACQLFARTSPNQKGMICRSIRNSGNWPLMVGDGTNDILAMRESAAGISLASGINLDKKSPAAASIHDSTNNNSNTEDKPKNVGIIQMLKNNYNSVEEDKVVQPSTIASSFATSDHSPMKVLDILRQGQSTLAIVRFCIIISVVYTMMIFMFDLMMFSHDLTFTDSQLMIEGIMAQVLFSMVIASKTSMSMINTRNLNKKGKICNLRMVLNIFCQCLVNFAVIAIVHKQIVGPIENQCLNDKDDKAVSPCKAIYHYVFMFLEVTTILFSYPGNQFLVSLFDTNLFKLILAGLMAIVYMLVNGITFGKMTSEVVEISSTNVNALLMLFAVTTVFKYMLCATANPFM